MVTASSDGEIIVEMPCIKCGVQMRLALIEPQGQNFDFLTYQCIPCAVEETFLRARACGMGKPAGWKPAGLLGI